MGSRVLDDKHVLDWDEEDVQEWFAGLGYPQYQQELRGNPSPSPILSTAG